MPGKVIDLSGTIQLINNKDKEKALKLISKFDIEWSEDRSKVKHYPLDDYSETSTPEDMADRIARISQVLWHTVVGYIEKELLIAFPTYDPDGGLLKAFPVGERKFVKPKKIGKIYTCQPARFVTVNVPVDVVQPYLYTYLNEDGGTEMMAEINFGIEIY